MYIVKTDNNGTDYLKVMEDYSIAKDGIWKRKKRVVMNLGPLARFDDGKPGYLDRLRESFRAGEPMIEQLKELVGAVPASDIVRIAFDKDSEADCFSDPRNIGYFILDALFDELGLYDVLNLHKSRAKVDFDLVGIARLLVFGRVVDPDSKLATWERRDHYLFDVCACDDLSEVYYALDDLNAKATAIQKRMDLKIGQTIGRDAEICYYDVTNYFFEIKQGDKDVLDEKGNVIKEGWRKSGPSKEKNRKPIVQMGLFTDKNAIPISYKLFPGNHIDQTTLRPTIKESLDQMGYGRVIVIADGGINSAKNLAHIVKGGNGYIVSKSPKGSPKAEKSWIADDAGYEWNKQKTFKVKSRVRTRTVKDEDGRPVGLTERVVSYWSLKHYERAMAENASFVAYLDDVTESPDKLKDKQPKIQKYLKKTKVDKKTGEVLNDATDALSLDWDKIAQDQALAGYYTIITSEIGLSEREIIDRYHGLSRIEDAFRTIKTDLEGRPVFVRTPEHINAHFLICFIALTMVRILQHLILKARGNRIDPTHDWESGLSAERIKAALGGFMADALPGGYYRLTKVDGDLATLLDALNISASLRIPSASDLRHLKHSIDKAKLMLR
jgi:hypothetical protein